MSYQNFEKSLKVLFNYEGGYTNDKDDKGGATNLGVTQYTYNAYRKKHNLPVKNVKNITAEEAKKIYYEEYWVPSGADKIEDPGFAMAIFDTSVLHGGGTAQKFLQQSGYNLDKFLDIRRQSYDRIVEKDHTQKKFYNGWNNRVNSLKIKTEKLSKEYSTKASNNESPLLLKGYVSYNQNNDDEYLRKAEIINKLKSPQNTKILQVHNMIQNTKTTKQDIDFDESKDYSGYINEVTNSNKIYTKEDLESMTETELQQNKSAIDYQRQTIGIPTNKQAKDSGMVFVNSYTRSDGVQVKSYYRTRPD